LKNEKEDNKKMQHGIDCKKHIGAGKRTIV